MILRTTLSFLSIGNSNVPDTGVSNMRLSNIEGPLLILTYGIADGIANAFGTLNIQFEDIPQSNLFEQ